MKALLILFVATAAGSQFLGSGSSVECPNSCKTFGLPSSKESSLFERYYNIINSTGLLNFTSTNVTIDCEDDVGLLTLKVWKQINEKVTDHSLTFGFTSKGFPYAIVRYIDEEFNMKNNFPLDRRSYVTFNHLRNPNGVNLQVTVVWRFMQKEIECETVRLDANNSDIYFFQLLKSGNVR